MGPILVTGAAGFIGSHTTDQLLAEGHEVVGVDNWLSGRRENLARAMAHPRFRLAEFDLAEPGRLVEFTSKVAPEAIIHLAALVSVPQSIANPSLNFRLNIEVCHVVAEAARQCGTPRVVFASSAAVYGTGLELPASENSAGHPLSPYGAAKLAAEAMFIGHAASYGFVVRIQRYFNVYGPRQNPDSPYSGVISVLNEKFRRGVAPTIFGDGEQTRDFISVHDVARANVIAATRSGAVSGIANICTGVATPVNRIAAILRAYFPGAPAPEFARARAGDIRHSFGSPSRAFSELDFAPTVDLRDGLGELAGAAAANPAH